MPLPVRPEILNQVAATAGRIDALGWGEATGGNLSLLLSEEDLLAPFRPAGSPLYRGSVPGEAASYTGATPGAEPSRSAVGTGDLPLHAGAEADAAPVLPNRLAAAEGWPEGRYLLVSATGSRMRELAADPVGGLCLVGVADGRLHAGEGSGPPSSELPVHMAVQWRREPGSALLHSHPDFLIALSHLSVLSGEGAMERALLPLMPEAALFLGRGLYRMDFEMPGGDVLASRSAAALREADILIWDRHGALAAGESLARALDRLELAEKAARIWWISHQTGEEPSGMPAGLFAALRERL